MRVRSLFFVAVLALAAPAFAQQTPTLSSKDYIQAALQSDRFEILSGYTARTGTRDPRVRAFAEMMIRDHTQTTRAMRQAATRAGVEPPPPSLSGDGSRMLGALQSLRGADLDRAYAEQQTLGHAEALVVNGLYAQTGSAPPLRQAAQGVLPMIRTHADQARQLKASLGGS